MTDVSRCSFGSVPCDGWPIETASFRVSGSTTTVRFDDGLFGDDMAAIRFKGMRVTGTVVSGEVPTLHCSAGIALPVDYHIDGSDVVIQFRTREGVPMAIQNGATHAGGSARWELRNVSITDISAVHRILFQRLPPPDGGGKVHFSAPAAERPLRIVAVQSETGVVTLANDEVRAVVPSGGAAIQTL